MVPPGTPTAKPPAPPPSSTVPPVIDEPAPGACKPGVARCVGLALQICRESGQEWREVVRCEAASLCSAALPAPMCLAPPPCVPGQHRCRGIDLQECDSVSGKFKTKETCEAPTTCSTLPPACVAAACSDGDVRCSGHELQKCQAGIWEVTTACDSGELCDPVSKACQDCVPAFCTGSSRYTCDLGTREWRLADTCGPSEACMPDGCTSCDAGVSCP